MAINWPTSPSVGQFYPTSVSVNETQWIWNGTGWAKVINAGQTVSVFVLLDEIIQLNLLEFPFPDNPWTLLTTS